MFWVGLIVGILVTVIVCGILLINWLDDVFRF